MTVAERLTTPPGPRRVLLFGNPNTGKTTLFNRLCGLRAKTANFPGTTSDLRRGRLSLSRAGSAAGAAADAEPVEVVDLPGLYSLTLDLPESRVGMAAVEGADGVPPAAAIVVADATNLQRNLLLVAELARTGTPFVVALNMIDLARRRGLSFDLERLADAIGAPVVPIAARKGEGIDELLTTLRGLLDDTIPTGLSRIPEGGTDAVESWSERVVVESVGGRSAYGSATDTVLDRLDVAFTHPISGFVIFHLVMAVLFWTIFALATVPMDLIEATFSNLGSLLETNLPAGAVRDLLVGGLIGGVSGTVVFLPQICLLFFLITLLEDTGYLARAAFVMDRLLYRFGLPGYAFVPLLSSHACAIPGILATRLIPDRNDRFATILVAPFMSCSARLPVYVLLTNFLFPDSPGLAGLAFTGCYLLGTVAALSSAFLARRTLLPGRSRPMVLELPTYKWPSLRVAVSQALEQGWSFLTTVGTVILAICVVMWWLSAYPKAAEPAEATALRALASERALAPGAVATAPSVVPDAPAPAPRVEDALGTAPTLSPETPESLGARADALALRHQQEQSFAGRLGRFAEPLFAPLGYDWRLTMGVLTSFAAREVLVSTLAVLVASPDDSERGVLRRIHDATRDDGSPLLTRATAVSMLVFFVLAMQCLSTVVTVRRETRHWKWPLLQFGWMTGLAWISAFAAFHGLHALGIS